MTSSTSTLFGDVKGEESATGDTVIPITRIHLDHDNPRHSPLESDREVIAQLCNTEFVSELARDIATKGALNPLDVLGVIPYEGHPGHYIVVEGNRRLCALILLSDPSRAPNPRLQRRFEQIATSTSVPNTVKVHVFSDRATAKPWIDLRHLGGQRGIGTREWNTEQKARAVGDNTKTTAKADKLALAVLERLSKVGLITADQRKQVPVTTLSRYLRTPGVRAILGLGSNSELIYTHDFSEVDEGLYQLVIDSITVGEDGTRRVHSRTDSADRLAYASELRAQGKAPVTPLESPSTPPANPSSTKPTGPATKRSARDPARIPTLFDRSFIVECKDPVLLRLRTEALSLKLDEYPFSANYLLRAFVEQTMILFAKERKKFVPGMKDETLTRVCAEELKAMGITGKALTVINQAAGSKDHAHSLHALGHAVHGGAIPTRQHLRAMFDTWKPTLRAMLDAL